MSTSESQQVANPFGSAKAPATTVAEAAVQREISEVQAAMVIAKRFPRNERASMDRIITECTRVSLAERAEYQYARGGTDISGPSIRLAETLARQWGNMLAGITELSRADGVSECLAYAWDLETNYREEKRFRVRHWRDRRSGGVALTDERDIYELIANQGARRKRACILAMIPGDVQDAAIDQCHLTLKSNIEITPERIKNLIAKFAEYKVTKAMLEARIQRRIDSITPALMVSLGRIYTSLKDGMSVASEWFQEADAGPVGEPDDDLNADLGVTGKSPQKPEQTPAEARFDDESAAALLNSKRALNTLESAWLEIVSDYKASGRDLPDSLRALHQERREHFGGEAKKEAKPAAQSQQKGPTAEEIMEAIERCTTEDQANDQLDLARGLPQKERTDILEVYTARVTAIRGESGSGLFRDES